MQRTANFVKRVDDIYDESRSERISCIRTHIARSCESPEGEWKRVLDAGELIEQAVTKINKSGSYRQAKKRWVYSPDNPSPRPYYASVNTYLVNIPYSPSDDES